MNQFFNFLRPIHKLLLLSVFFSLLIAPLTYHPDNKLVLNWASQEEGRVWNIWEYDLQGVGQFNYPPLHFYLDKLQYFIAKPLGGAGFMSGFLSPIARTTISAA